MTPVVLRLPSLFRTPKPKPFSYRPIYWNGKEEKRAGSEVRSTGSGERPAHLSFRNARRTYRAGEVSRANLRLIVIIFALLLIGYLILKT